MSAALGPEQTIVMSWEQYASGNFNRALIPWDKYRYSKNGIIQVPAQTLRNADIIDTLRTRLNEEIKRLNTQWRCYTHSISIEVEHHHKEERIPDLIIINKQTYELIGPNSRLLTLLMPVPILIVEMVDPSLITTAIQAREQEYLQRRIREYISIDWHNQQVIVRTLHKDETAFRHSLFKTGDTLTFNAFPSLNLTVDEILAP